jgi:UDP-N-acetylglucosamine transferase subunit ALG13
VIFATVGTQLPFPRMMTALDGIAGRHKLDVLAQTCDESYHPQNLTAKANLHPDEFAAAFKKASVVVAHAGIGTILSAKQHGKPLILMPRRAALGEHRNEHQMATVQQMRGRTGLYVAESPEELEELLLRRDLKPADNTPSNSRAALVGFLKDYIDQ